MGGHGRTLTCANEEDVVVSVNSCYTVRSDLGEGVPGTHLLEEGAPPHGQDRIVYMRGWFRANWMTSSGKSLVELKVPKVLLGHWGVGRRHDKDVDMKAWWAALHRTPPGTWSMCECVCARARTGGGCWTEPCPGNLREELQPCLWGSERETWPSPEEPCLMKMMFSHP